jgi:hypothetical protein
MAPPVVVMPVMTMPTPVTVVPMAVVPAPMAMMPMVAPAHLLRREPAGLLARGHCTMHIMLRRKWRRRQWRGSGVSHSHGHRRGNAKSNSQAKPEKTLTLHCSPPNPGVIVRKDLRIPAERQLNSTFRKRHPFPEPSWKNVSRTL